MRLGKLDLIFNSRLIKLKPLNDYEIYITIVLPICFQDFSKKFFKILNLSSIKKRLCYGVNHLHN